MTEKPLIHSVLSCDLRNNSNGFVVEIIFHWMHWKQNTIVFQSKKSNDFLPQKLISNPKWKKSFVIIIITCCLWRPIIISIITRRSRKNNKKNTTRLMFEKWDKHFSLYCLHSFELSSAVLYGVFRGSTVYSSALLYAVII